MKAAPSREPPSNQLLGFIGLKGLEEVPSLRVQRYNAGLDALARLPGFTRLTTVSFPIYAAWFSAGRLQRYHIACGGDEVAAVRLYQHNLRLAQAFYVPLQVVEVALRNALDERLRRHFGQDANWLITQQTGFMNHPALHFRDPASGKTRVRDRLRRSVEDARRNLPAGASPGKLVAELTFGFWTSLYDREHFRILQGQPLGVFRSLPPALKRQDVANHLRLIRSIRNRVYHYEPLCFSGDAVSLKDTLAAHRAIYDVCRWLGPDLLALIQELDRVSAAIRWFRRTYPDA